MDATLQRAISLLKEWMYEMSGADVEPSDHWTSDSLAHFSNMKRDYDRMCSNTLNFIEEVSHENSCFV